MEKATFLLPEKIANELLPTLITRYKITTVTNPFVVHTTKMLVTRCRRFELPKKQLDTFLAKTGLKSIDIGIMGASENDPKNLDVEILYGHEVNAGSLQLTIDLDDGKPFLGHHPLIATRIKSVMGHFMECTGLSARVHVIQGPVYEPLPETRDADMHIVLGASPYGDTHIVDVQTLCGLQLHKDRHWYHVNGPTLGRGTVIADEDGVDNLQIVGNVVYLFAPRIDHKTEWIFTEGGGDLFAKQVRLASAALAKGVEPPVERIIETAEEFDTVSRTRLTAELKVCETRLQKADEDAVNALTLYRAALDEKRAYLYLRESVKARTTEVQERLAEAFKHIRDMPLTHRIVTVGDDAIHVETKRVIGRVGDKRYDYGTFAARWSPGGKVSIWPLVTTHPKGVPHPHIGIAGNVCFGNVGPVIERAFQEEMRPDEGFELLFDWFVDGYDENLAEHKADEWPEVTEYSL